MRPTKETLRRHWLHLSLIACFTVSVFFLMYLDYFNLEKLSFFNNLGFAFEITWKGRMFLLFFLALFGIETLAGFKWLGAAEANQKSKVKIVAAITCALIPLLYILAVNYLGLDQFILRAGELVRLDYWQAVNPANWPNSLNIDWPLSIEYVVFAVSFLATVLLAYGKRGLKAFCLTTALIVGVSLVYMIDTMYPFWTFTPFQAFVLPTTAYAANILQAMGIHFSMAYSPSYASAPIISVSANGSSSPASVAWPCAGVHNLFLFVVFMLLVLTKFNMSSFRKSIYFVVGAIGTFTVNAFRIVGFFVVLINQGDAAASTFHNIYGEIFFYAWMALFVLLILFIQKFKLVEKTKSRFSRKPAV
jgi:thaumarchaeosortase